MAVPLFHKHYPHPTSDRYLIVLHGLFGMLDNWHHMAGKLSQHLNVLTVDQRNHGHSPHVDQMSYEAMAEDLEELMDELSIDRAVILGHSMGGKTAMVFADLYPQRVDSLIVVDIAPRAYSGGHEQYFKAFDSMDLSSYQRRSEVDQAFAQFESDPAIRQFLLKNLMRVDHGFRFKFHLPPIEAFYPRMIAALDFHWLITMPSLFLYGQKSVYVREEDKDDIARTFTDVQFMGIPNAGHWVHAEQPEAFYSAVCAFLSIG